MRSFLSPSSLLMLGSLALTSSLILLPAPLPFLAKLVKGVRSQRGCRANAYAGQLSPHRTSAPGHEMAMSGSRPILLVYPCSFSNTLPYHSTFSSSFSLPPPPPACCACFFLSPLLFPSFPFCFFPPSPCFLNQFQIDIEMLFFCFVDHGLDETSFRLPFPLQHNHSIPQAASQATCLSFCPQIIYSFEGVILLLLKKKVHQVFTSFVT